MATSVPVITVKAMDATRRHVTRQVQLVFAAGDYATNGIPLDLTKAVNGANQPYGLFSGNPSYARVINQPKYYQLKVVKGTSPASGWLAFIAYETGSAGVFAEHAAGAIDTKLVSDTEILVEFLTLKGK